MLFEWDNAKAARNHAKHRVTFEYATRVFYEDTRHVIVADDRKNYGETRYAAFGEVESRVYVVAFTRRGNVIRIISARKGNRREQKKYYALRA